MNPFPPHWSPEQALAVDQFLLSLRDQLWHQYQHQLRPLFEDAVEHHHIPADEHLSDLQQPLFDDSEPPF